MSPILCGPHRPHVTSIIGGLEAKIKQKIAENYVENSNMSNDRALGAEKKDAVNVAGHVVSSKTATSGENAENSGGTPNSIEKKRNPRYPDRDERGRWLPGATTAGRPKGVPNRTSQRAALMVLEALDRLGGTDWIERIARDDPKLLTQLLARLMPRDIQVSSTGIEAWLRAEAERYAESVRKRQKSE